jgi:hypothetical protein
MPFSYHLHQFAIEGKINEFLLIGLIWSDNQHLLFLSFLHQHAVETSDAIQLLILHHVFSFVALQYCKGSIMHSRELYLRGKGFQLGYCEIRHGNDSIKSQSNPYREQLSVIIELGK